MLTGLFVPIGQTTTTNTNIFIESMGYRFIDIELEGTLEVILQINVILGEETIFSWPQNKLIAELK